MTFFVRFLLVSIIAASAAGWIWAFLVQPGNSTKASIPWLKLWAEFNAAILFASLGAASAWRIKWRKTLANWIVFTLLVGASCYYFYLTFIVWISVSRHNVSADAMIQDIEFPMLSLRILIAALLLGLAKRQIYPKKENESR